MCRIFRRRPPAARSIEPSSCGRDSILVGTVQLRKGVRPREASPSDRYPLPASLVARVGDRKSTVLLRGDHRATEGTTTVLLRKSYRATKEIWPVIYLQIGVFSRKW